MCGEDYSVRFGMARFLFGESKGNIKYIQEILYITKMTFEVAFQ